MARCHPGRARSPHRRPTRKCANLPRPSVATTLASSGAASTAASGRSSRHRSDEAPGVMRRGAPAGSSGGDRKNASAAFCDRRARRRRAPCPPSFGGRRRWRSPATDRPARTARPCCRQRRHQRRAGCRSATGRPRRPPRRPPGTGRPRRDERRLGDDDQTELPQSWHELERDHRAVFDPVARSPTNGLPRRQRQDDCDPRPAQCTATPRPLALACRYTATSCSIVGKS